MKSINWCTLTCCIVVIEAVHRLQHPSHPAGITFGHSIGLGWRLITIGGAYTFVDAGIRTPSNSIWEDGLKPLHPPYRIYTLIYVIVSTTIRGGLHLGESYGCCGRFGHLAWVAKSADDALGLHRWWCDDVWVWWLDGCEHRWLQEVNPNVART